MPTTIGRVRVTALRCERCGHVWLPRIHERPALCPKCKSLRWDKASLKPVKAK